LSSTEKKKQEPPYTLKGIPIHGYLTETGDFKWIPHASACGDKEHALEIPKTLEKMSEDKRHVWATRFDEEKAIAVCPIIHEDKDIAQVFAEFFSPYNPSKLRNIERRPGGEGTK
jgi:hypothetical protein